MVHQPVVHIRSDPYLVDDAFLQRISHFDVDGRSLGPEFAGENDLKTSEIIVDRKTSGTPLLPLQAAFGTVLIACRPGSRSSIVSLASILVRPFYQPF